MAEIKAIVDEYGVIREAAQVLPSDKLKVAFLEALAELEDNEAHRTRTYSKTRLHEIVGVKKDIYRADIDKVSGWRLHVQFRGGALHLKQVVAGTRHDAVLQVVNSQKDRFE